MSLFLSLIVLISLSGCSSNSSDEELRELAKIEIKEFEGKALSSILEFRKNSINGPQKLI